MYDEKAALAAQNVEAERRIKKLKEAVEQLKRQEKTLKRPSTSQGRAVTPASPAVAIAPQTSESPSVPNTAKLQELTSRLGLRLENAEQQLARVREENRRLKQQVGLPGPEVAIDATLASSASPVLSDEGSSRLHRELHDARAKLTLLQTRYDHLEAKARAQTELQQGSYDQLEDYNRRLREIRRALQDSQVDKAAAESRAARAEELELEAAELRRQNQKFEEKITKLCESPFISSAYDQEEKLQRLQEHERKHAALQLKIEHLTETAHGHHAALVAMKQHCDSLKEERDAAVAEVEELRARQADSAHEARLLQDKMRLYAGEDGVDMGALEQALTIVKRREGVPDLGHLRLEAVDGGDLKAKVRELYEANQTLAYEAERAEAMLKAQLAINRELHLELESAERAKSADAKALADRVQALEGELARGEAKVRRLEAQRKQRAYPVRASKNARSGAGGGRAAAEKGGADGDGEGEGEGVELASVAEDNDTLMEELGGERLGEDENLVEVWVREACLDAMPDAPTFALVDFFHFESEATPVLEGRSPRYDFASSYRVTVDDALLSFLATECLVVEVCQVQGAGFELLARAAVPLDPLLRSRPQMKLGAQPLLGRDGKVVGTVNLEVRLGKALDELYDLFLSTRPAEQARIDKVHAARYGHEVRATRRRLGGG